MAKRFTDTSKWGKDAFSKLPLKMKLVWVYLCDCCDHAGVWDVNLNLLSFQIGEKITIQEITESFGDWVELRGPSKLYLPAFIEFQYGNLNPENRVHKSILDRVSKLVPKDTCLSPLREKISPLQGAMEMDMELELELELDKGSVRGKFDFEDLYALYPNKVNKADGIKRLGEQIKTIGRFNDFKLAVENYKKYLSLEKNREWMQAKQFDVFVGPKSKEVKPWEEWINPDPSVFEDKKACAPRATLEELEAMVK